MIPKSGVRFSDKIMRKKEGAERREAHPTSVRATLPDVTVRQCAGRGSGPRRQVHALCALFCLRSPLAFRRSTAAPRRLHGSSPGRASWNYRVQTGGPSPAPVQQAPCGPVVSAGRYDARSRPSAGLRAPPAGTASRSTFGTSPVTPSMSEIRNDVFETVTVVVKHSVPVFATMATRNLAAPRVKRHTSPPLRESLQTPADQSLRIACPAVHFAHG